jgi:hypothetical protein
VSKKTNKEVTESDITGMKYFDKLAPLLARLHDVGCERDKAGNRELHMDQYCLLVLLYLFNPICSSLRAIQQASELPKVQKLLGCPRAALGSLSEAAGVFNSERLIEIIQELGGQLKPIAKDPRLKDVTLTKTLTLVDATLVKALPSVMAASVLRSKTGSALVKWRLHSQFEVDRYVPTRIDVTGEGGGENDERAVFEKNIQPDRLYAMDRGYAKFTLFNAIVDKGSSYVCRIRDNSVYEVHQDREVTDKGREANVLTDQVVTLGQSSKKSDRPNHPIRIVVIKIRPHKSAGKYQGGSSGVDSDGFLRIATNLLDVPAEIIALLYFYRWTIEIFFRMFKQMLGCRHLISHKQNGIEIQTYCGIIACLLISLWTGRKPTLRTYEMICYYMMGWADEATLTAHILKLQKQDAEKNRS